MYKVPTLTVIAGRPASNRPFEETHRTVRRWSVVEEVLAAIGLGFLAVLLWLAMHLG